MLFTRAQVEQVTGLSRTSVYRLMRKGRFPTPVRIGDRAVRWDADELNRWIESRPRATGDGPRANGATASK